MNDQQENNADILDEVKDFVETIEFDFDEAWDDTPAPQKHTLLETWREVLSNIENLEKNKLSMREAGALLQQFPFLIMSDLRRYPPMYWSKMKEMRDIVLVEIESDPEALTKVETDAVDNKHHYLNILVGWQRLVRQWEDAWDVGQTRADLEFIAIAQVHAFFLSQNGLVAHLSEIEMEFSQEDAQTVAEAIEAE